VTAGLFEEVGRYIGYRWLMGRETKTWSKAVTKTWSKAVMYGLGHGGLESILLVAGLSLLSLVGLLVLLAINVEALPAAQRPQVVQQLHAAAAIAAQPGWVPLLGAWERLWTLPIQVALSVIVLQVFRRGSIRWLWLAVLAHALVDGVTTVAAQLLGSNKLSTDLIVEAIVALFGLVALWVIFTLRERPGETGVPMGQPAANALSRTNS
jgi:uncharacterized membrane protein YhfC